MTYTVGDIIQGSDYNAFVGTTSVSSGYASNAAAQNKVAALIGVGFGSRGYGQTSTNVTTVGSNVQVSAGQWNNLRSAMSTLNTHTGSGLTLQPTVAIGDTIQAYDGSGGRANIPSLISTLDTNRYSADIAQMAVTSVLTSSTTTPWNTSITHVFTVDFGTEDRARYYFNSGGEIRFSGSHVGGSGAVDAAWTALLAAVGTVKLDANTTTYTGSGGSITNDIGFYGLTGAYQQIFIHYGSGSYYSPIYYSINVLRENRLGVNGGNGSLVRCLVTFSEGTHYYGSVTGTTTSQIDQYKAGGVLTIQAPTWTTVTPLP